MEKNLEKRMYFFTIYQLTGIQCGIQCGHAALEYAAKYGTTKEFDDFIKNWKTWIILNGGTTNNQRELGTGKPLGSLNDIADQLLENKIAFTHFEEPDLNNALTALCFICDERVFNKEDYPDFINYLIDISNKNISAQEIIQLRMMPYEELIRTYGYHYEKWINFVGGAENIFLRELLKDKEKA